jgi:hypothetical protein
VAQGAAEKEEFGGFSKPFLRSNTKASQGQGDTTKTLHCLIL